MTIQNKSRYKMPVFATYFSLMALALLTSCSIEKPQSPTWRTNWDIPIANKAYSIFEILEDMGDSNVVVDSAGFPGFEIRQEFDTIRAEGNLTTDGVNLHVRDSLGLIDIPQPDSITSTTDLYDILPVNLGVIPPASFDYDQPLDTVSRFSWVDVESGDVILTFTNMLDCDLDTFIVTFTDLADDHVISVSNFPGGLPDNSTRADTVALDGQRISNALSVNFTGVTLAGGVIVDVGQPHYIETAATFPTDITVSAGRTETPEITLSQTQSTALNDSSVIQSSVIESGDLQLTIINDAQIPFTVEITSSCFQNGGTDLSLSRQVPGNSTAVVSQGLAGYSFIPVDGTMSSQLVVVDVSAYAPGSAPFQYTFSASDSISVEVALSTIIFESITGRIQPTVIALPESQHELDIPDGLDQARLTMAEMALNLYNNSTVPSDVDLVVAGDGRTLDIHGRIDGKLSPADPPELTTISVGSEDLSNFLNPPPGVISISGNATMNPDYDIVTLTAADYINGDIYIYSPFALAISSPVSIDMGISDCGIDHESRPDNFTETFRHGSIDVDLESHLPLSVAATIYIGTRPDSGLFDDPGTLILGPDTLQAGAVGPDGRVTESVLSQLSFTLDSHEIGLFDNDIIYYAQHLELLTTDSTGVQIHGTDYLRIKAYGTVQVQFGDNLWGGN
jgi:hypothetical protein